MSCNNDDLILTETVQYPIIFLIPIAPWADITAAMVERMWHRPNPSNGVFDGMLDLGNDTYDEVFQNQNDSDTWWRRVCEIARIVEKYK